MGYQVMIVCELDDPAGYPRLRSALEARHWSFHKDGMPLPRMCCWAEVEGCATAAEAEREAETSFMEALVSIAKEGMPLAPIRLAFMAFWPATVIVKAA